MLNFDYLKNLPKKQLYSIIGVTILLLAIPLGAYLSQKTQIFKPRALETACQSDQTGTPVEEQCIDNTKVLVFSYSQDGACKQFYEPAPGSCSIFSPTPASKPGDINGDGKVDIFDYNIMIFQFGQSGNFAADINKDGKVDIFDYNILVQNFGK